MKEIKTMRLVSVDSMRGLIMILMALDHAKKFVTHKRFTGEHWGGYFPFYREALDFITRLVTHPAAPGFFFLMGIGMYYFAQARRSQGWSEWKIIGHFILRGLVLIIIQLTIVNKVWELGSGNPNFPDIYVGVLFALGCTMIIASFLLTLKPAHWLIIALILFIGTELLHPDPSLDGTLNNPWGLLTFYSGYSSKWHLSSNYPFLPWLELVIFGLAVGSWIKSDSRSAYKRIFWVGVSFIVGFIIIRYLDGFGNIRPREGDSWIDFLNFVKYPPSMTFSLLTMGVNLMLLAGFGQITNQLSWKLNPLTVFGRVPLFFYITHLYLYYFMGIRLTPDGTSIPQMYPYWLLGLLVLYPFCWGYGKLKERYPNNLVLRYI